jgi:glyoxylase-like metal-dependent hydrolase (beta-lactamase superfamily II)
MTAVPPPPALNADGTPYDGSADVAIGACTVLTGVDLGRYPHGNSVFVQGRDQSLLVDPSLSLGLRPPGSLPGAVDQIFVSHAHEDHIAANGLFPHSPVHIHGEDVIGVQSVDGILEVYGFDDQRVADDFRQTVVEEFFFDPRPDAVPVDGGHVFDLGGVRVEVVHLPGHTRGHCGALIGGTGVAYLGDVDLTGFGPYYGDAWSSLEDFRRTLDLCRDLEASTFVTFHHKHVVEGRERFLGMLADFADVIARRDEELLAFLAEPRTLEDIVERRFVYRPHVDNPSVPSIERRSMSQHLVTLVSEGRAVEVEPGRWRAA